MSPIDVAAVLTLSIGLVANGVATLSTTALIPLNVGITGKPAGFVDRRIAFLCFEAPAVFLAYVTVTMPAGGGPAHEMGVAKVALTGGIALVAAIHGSMIRLAEGRMTTTGVALVAGGALAACVAATFAYGEFGG